MSDNNQITVSDFHAICYVTRALVLSKDADVDRLAVAEVACDQCGASLAAVSVVKLATDFADVLAVAGNPSSRRGE